MKTILVPTDFSSTADAALEVGIGIAKKTGAELILLHVVEDIDDDSFNVVGEVSTSESGENRLFTLMLLKKVRKQLTDVTEQVSKRGVKVASRLRLGNAYHGMHATIIEQNVDLVVMGTKGSSGYEEILVGSNTEKVVRRSSCPVLTVNKKPLNSDFKSIVYATSLVEGELVFSKLVKKVQEIYNCPVHVVRINTPGLFISDLQVKQKMESFVKEVGFTNYTINVYNDFTEEDGIIHFAESMNADMIAMATHGRTGLAHILNGSIAEDVVNHAHRPVLTNVVGRKPIKKVKA